jgi:hypothetical protein
MIAAVMRSPAVVAGEDGDDGGEEEGAVGCPGSAADAYWNVAT